MLDDSERRKRLDTRGMFGILSSLPEQLEEGLSRSEGIGLESLAEGRIFAVGMGGSAIAGDIGASIAQHVGRQVHVVRDFRLPSYITADDLLIFISYSGDTWETLSAFQEALWKGHQCLTISSGGGLHEISSHRGTPHVSVPKGLPPRGALGYLLAPLLRVLAETTPDLMRQVEGAIQHLSRRRAAWAPSVATEENEAKGLAMALRSKTPIVYSPTSLNCVAKRWQTQLNENAKVLAWCSMLPEASHNEIVGWVEDPEGSRFSPVFLLPEGEGVFDAQVREVVALIEERHPVQVVRPSHREFVGQNLEMVLLGDLVSLYLAIVRGVDPFPVEPIERLKARMRHLGTGQ